MYCLIYQGFCHSGCPERIRRWIVRCRWRLWLRIFSCVWLLRVIGAEPLTICFIGLALQCWYPYRIRRWYPIKTCLCLCWRTEYTSCFPLHWFAILSGLWSRLLPWQEFTSEYAPTTLTISGMICGNSDIGTLKRENNPMINKNRERIRCQ